MSGTLSYRRGFTGRALGRAMTSLDMAQFRRSISRARSRRMRGLGAALPHLPKWLLGELADSLDEVRIRRGDVIVREGDPADRFFVIESGQVEGTQSAQNGDVHVRTMHAGDHFGEVGLLETSTRTAT